ncbi:hypothetical protein AZ54_16430 [Xanthomonas oryzae pv. oryzae PXO86]|uniref:Uncharacterized protein n=1 Tax=Xanthomonas oryzae pv. oryzae (strain PXO99A) TaxID=360094 RepID=A0A0K0GIP8_XANOP|nr:hypothetical protein PXO_05530 [Xanthomonas oryzae pv. oryzae PXO99A]AJQ83989.1 hypothetical protein AZ54_16430 [Xanthomonas oryzae pv. oryzae PXO86]
MCACPQVADDAARFPQQNAFQHQSSKRLPSAIETAVPAKV